jgi:hypothetical protein
MNRAIGVPFVPHPRGERSNENEIDKFRPAPF